MRHRAERERVQRDFQKINRIFIVPPCEIKNALRPKGKSCALHNSKYLKYKFLVNRRLKPIVFLDLVLFRNSILKNSSSRLVRGLVKSKLNLLTFYKKQKLSFLDLVLNFYL